MSIRRYLSLLALAVVVLLATLVWFYPSGADFISGNRGWNGAREFCNTFGVDVVHSLDDLPAGPEGALLIAIPYQRYSAGELAVIERFVASGGVLLLADDYGNGNQVLDYLQANAGFSGEQLVDPLFNYVNSSMPEIVDFEDSGLVDGVQSIILNHATALTVGDDWQVVASSSEASFIDLNDNRTADAGEQAGPLTVAATLGYGRGSIILLSDPSMIINCMLDLADNYIFMDNILHFDSAEAGIMLDQSHLSGDGLDEAKGWLGAARDALAAPAGVAGIGTIIIALTLYPIWITIRGGKDGRRKAK